MLGGAASGAPAAELYCGVEGAALVSKCRGPPPRVSHRGDSLGSLGQRGIFSSGF